MADAESAGTGKKSPCVVAGRQREKVVGGPIVCLNFRTFEEGNEIGEVVIRDICKGVWQGRVNVMKLAIATRAA